jgi:hypothetical protein
MGNRPVTRPPGETRLRHALRSRAARQQRPPPRPPLDLRPTTPFEQQLLAHYEQLRRDFDDLKKRVDWLTLAILGTALTFVIERVLSGSP